MVSARARGRGADLGYLDSEPRTPKPRRGDWWVRISTMPAVQRHCARFAARAAMEERDVPPWDPEASRGRDAQLTRPRAARSAGHRRHDATVAVTQRDSRCRSLSAGDAQKTRSRRRDHRRDKEARSREGQQQKETQQLCGAARIHPVVPEATLYGRDERALSGSPDHPHDPPWVRWRLG
jgi:hypothetical protein